MRGRLFLNLNKWCIALAMAYYPIGFILARTALIYIWGFGVPTAIIFIVPYNSLFFIRLFKNREGLLENEFRVIGTKEIILFVANWFIGVFAFVLMLFALLDAI